MLDFLGAYMRLLDEPCQENFPGVPIKILERTVRMHGLPFDVTVVTSSVSDLIADLEELFDQCRCKDHNLTSGQI